MGRWCAWEKRQEEQAGLVVRVGEAAGGADWFCPAVVLGGGRRLSWCWKRVTSSWVQMAER